MNQDQARLFGFDPDFKILLRGESVFQLEKGNRDLGRERGAQLCAGGEVCVPPRAGRRRQSRPGRGEDADKVSGSAG